MERLKKQELLVTAKIRSELIAEIEGYKKEEYPELPWDISLRVELAGVEYDLSKYESVNGVYSNVQIKQALLDGHIRIFPYHEEQMNPTSYDVQLGEWFYKTDTTHNRAYYNFYDQADVKRYFGEVLRSEEYRLWRMKQNAVDLGSGIDDATRIIVLNPGERILAHSHEWIGIKGPGTTSLHAKSTTGRNGIVTHKDAGWGDPGFLNRWTKEIQNDNNERVTLRVGSRYAQMVFHGTGLVHGAYGEDGRYYTTRSLVEDVDSWTPDQMLPRGYKEAYKPPIEIDLKNHPLLRQAIDEQGEQNDI